MAEEMRKQTLERLRGLGDSELAGELANERKRLFDLRRERITRQLENTSQVPQTKKQIARILTLLAERQRAAGGE